MMHKGGIWTILVATLLAGTALAQAPESSPVPVPRPSESIEQSARLTPEVGSFDPSLPGLTSSLRPKPRPLPHKPAPTQINTPSVARLSSAGAVLVSLHPKPRPKRAPVPQARLVAASAVQTQPSPLVTSGRKGSVCGVRGIKGVKLAPIPGKLQGCGVAQPVRISSIDGVALTQASIMDCQTAKSLNQWVKQGVKPTIGRLGGGVASLKVAAHYSCRTRNNKPGAKISEHGKGHAIDISAINLKNGTAIHVQSGWRDPQQGKLLKAMHQQACGPFGTVLGPSADRYHQDHFHFDTARYRSGAYCR